MELILSHDGVLMARDFSDIESADGREAGIAVRCSDGSDRFHCVIVRPTEREFHGIQLPEGRVLYATMRGIVIEQAGLEPDDLPWVEYDAAGDAVPGTDSNARLEEWLERVVSGDRLEGWIGGRVSEYGIALEILDVLSKSERELWASIKLISAAQR